MKKIFSILALSTALFISCDKSEYEIHQTYFVPANPQGKQLYADQTKDSVRVYSYDPWTAATNIVGEQWFTITPTTCNFKAGTQLNDTRIDITALPNTSGKIRGGLIMINSYYNLGMSLYQLNWLNISRPIGRLITHDAEGNELSKEEQYCVFEISTIPTKHQFNIEFTTYSELATLTTTADWLSPEGTEFEAGKHVVSITCEDNSTDVARQAQIVLTSNGVSSTISLTQERKND